MKEHLKAQLNAGTFIPYAFVQNADLQSNAGLFIW